MDVAAQPFPSSYSAPRRSFNFRLIALVGLGIAPFLWFGYVIFAQMINGGISDHGSYADVDLKTLGSFTFDQDSDTIQKVPAPFRALDGRRVVLVGKMWTDPKSADAMLSRFELVYSITECCFKGPPLVQERVYAAMPKGTEVKYYPPSTTVRVVGTLHVKVQKDGDRTISLFTMAVDSLKPS